MLGKQWANQYLPNHGGSATNGSYDRQRKLDVLQKWHFHLTTKGLPVMLQLTLLSLRCALLWYLWTINHTVVRVIITITVIGVTSCLPHPCTDVFPWRPMTPISQIWTSSMFHVLKSILVGPCPERWTTSDPGCSNLWGTVLCGEGVHPIFEQEECWTIFDLEQIS